METPSVMDSLPWKVTSILSVCTIPTEHDQGLSKQESNILTYIAGYIVRKIREKICVTCSSKISGVLDPDNPNHDFIAEKSSGHLLIPSKLLLGMM